jgi:hypothetical protein
VRCSGKRSSSWLDADQGDPGAGKVDDSNPLDEIGLDLPNSASEFFVGYV